MSNYSKLHSWCSIVLVTVILHCTQLSSCDFMDDDLRITYKQKVTLDKFRELMASRLPHEYMKEDIFLMRWLRAQNYDLKQAEQMLVQDLKWRRDNRMDTIHHEDWTDMESEFPSHMDGFGKRGQPIFTATVGDWDFRQAALTGKLPRFYRYIEQQMDQGANIIREEQRQGINVTRFMIIMSAEGFSLSQHICSSCISGLLRYLYTLDLHYPGHTDKAILINVPPAAQFGIDIIKTTLRPETSKALHVFGRNRKQWEKFIRTYVDKEQLRSEYGGTKQG